VEEVVSLPSPIPSSPIPIQASSISATITPERVSSTHPRTSYGTVSARSHASVKEEDASTSDHTEDKDAHDSSKDGHEYDSCDEGGDSDWLKEMAIWLETEPHGTHRKVCSPANARSVMRQVRLLAAGKGITYKHWPANVYFRLNDKINLSYDFGQLILEAKQYENRYGEDKGHGWLLTHPIKKLRLFQEYLRLKKQNSQK